MPDKITDYSKINIFYPVIGYTGMVHSDYMMSTINLLLLCRQKNIKLGMRSIWFESLISRARNASVAFMLAKEYTHLLFVDTDVSFDAHDVLKLVDQQKEVVVGVYPKKYWSHQKMQAMGASGSFPEQWKHLATDFCIVFSEAADVCFPNLSGSSVQIPFSKQSSVSSSSS